MFYQQFEVKNPRDIADRINELVAGGWSFVAFIPGGYSIVGWLLMSRSNVVHD